MPYNIPEIESQLLLLTRQFLLEQEKERALRALEINMSLERQLGIDSLSKVELFHRIEKTFGVQFSDQVMAEADSLSDIARAIPAAKLAEKMQIQNFAPQLQQVDIDLSQIVTLQQALVEYARHEPQRPHIYLQDDKGHEEIITYGLLLAKATDVATNLIAKGIQPDDTVALMLPTSIDFFASFFGILLVGAIPVPIYPPFRPDRLEEYAMREAMILNNAEVRMLITFAQAKRLGKILRSSIPSLIAVSTAADLLKNRGNNVLPQILRNEEDTALIQYTSGSTGSPKGVLLQHRNILANIRAINKSLQLKPTDNMVSWLPLYHDMGLMSWISSLFFGLPITIMSPLTFLNHPERWLWAIHYHRATISAAPNFAYELAIKKIDDDVLEGLDLSCWRLSFNGAEAVSAQTIIKFYNKFKTYGYKKETMVPVYGLAENTVGLTIPQIPREVRIDRIARATFENDLRAIPIDGHKDYLEFVSEGVAIADHEIRIVDTNNQLLSERLVGNVQFRGPSAMQGYYRNPLATAAIYHEGWWETGDLGYLADGELFITGRKKDVIIKAGRNLYPETIEQIVSNVAGVRKGCVIAFGISDPHTGTEKIIIAAETKLEQAAARKNLQDTIIEQVAIHIGVPPDHVIFVPPHKIPKTSSGKLQRSACKQEYLEGKLLQKRPAVHWQILKLFSISAGKRMKFLFRNALRFFYTAYFACIFIITFFPTYLAILFSPSGRAATLVKSWATVLLKLNFCRLATVNPQHLMSATPAIYVANHASYADALALIAILPPGTVFIGKKELAQVPILAGIIKKLHYLLVDRWDFSKNIADTKRIEAIINDKHSILIFPEGTFTYASGLRPFKAGAFQLAVNTQTPIIPIAVNGTRKLLRDGSRLLNPSSLTLTVCAALKIQGNDWHEVNRLRQETRKIIAQYCGEATIDLIVPGP